MTFMAAREASSRAVWSQGCGRALSALMVAACLVAPARSQTQPAPSDTQAAQGGHQLGWHIVRPGDTLERITAKDAGTHELWQRNWRLNPEIRNPHLLLPGQRIRVLILPRRTVPAAQLARMSRRVEELANPNPWTQAQVEDLLLAGEVLASQTRVAVAAGMGTTVADGKPPSPPERLLPAPKAFELALGSEGGGNLEQLGRTGRQTGEGAAPQHFVANDLLRG